MPSYLEFGSYNARYALILDRVYAPACSRFRPEECLALDRRPFDPSLQEIKGTTEQRRCGCCLVVLYEGIGCLNLYPSGPFEPSYGIAVEFLRC